MNFYLYTNKNLLFDFLGRNIIAPDIIVKDIKRYRTIASASDLFLFVTHKKLDRKSREYGIAEPEFVYPVAMELSVQQEADGKAILVRKKDDAYEYSYDTLANYDPEKNIGVYLIGEIPFSRIQKIYFDTLDDMDMFSRPSPDYWYPRDKYALLPDDFDEEFCICAEDEQICDACGMTAEAVVSGIRSREKKRAGILNFVNATKEWQKDNYVFNMDSRLQDLLELTDDSIAEVLPHYLEFKDKDCVESLALVSGSKSEEPNQYVFDRISGVLIAQPYDIQKQPGLVIDILQNLAEGISELFERPQEKALVKGIIDDIEKLVSDDSDMNPEELSARIPEPINVLKALIFVVKNPNNYDFFLESLSAYHADMLTRRRAAVLWGQLNGLYGMPGEDFNKDNALLWQFIEWKVLTEEKEVPSLSVTKPETYIKNHKILGITLKEERIVTALEIREAILSMPKEEFDDAFYRKLLEAAEMEYGTKKKAGNKGYAYSVASIGLSEIKKGQELNAPIRKQLEALLKDCKATVPNKENLFKDYVEDKDKFDFVFRMDPAYWKKTITVAEEKKDEKL